MKKYLYLALLAVSVLWISFFILGSSENQLTEQEVLIITWKHIEAAKLDVGPHKEVDVFRIYTVISFNDDCLASYDKEKGLCWIENNH